MKKFLTNRVLTSGILFIGLAFNATVNSQQGEYASEILQFVDPFIGTGSHGHTFPGPVVPHGQIQLSPDTHLLGWDASSGYHYGDTTLYGFSHNHLSGTGIGDLGDILILPFTKKNGTEELVGVLDHAQEKATPGYYSIRIKPWNILAELTASKRVGWHRYTYPKSERARLKIDLAHILQPNWGHKTLEGEMEIIDSVTVKGYRKTTGWAINDPVWFIVKFDHPILESQFLAPEKSFASSHKIIGKDAIGLFDFGILKEPLNIRVSLSYSSEQGAWANSNTLPQNSSFETLKQEAETQWKKELERITVKSKDTAVLNNFYTALYHTRLMPFLFSDADGTYRGMDGELHVSSTRKFSAYSLWDTYRSWLPLMTLIDKEAVTKWSYDILQQGKEGGLLPKWTLNSNYTGTMVGYPATAFIADAMVKNLIDSTAQEFLDVSLKSSRWNAEFYEKWKGTRAENVMHKSIFYKDSLGFVPAVLINESVSYGLEMAFYDWCISQMANQLNQIEIRDSYLTKANAYKDYFDPEIGFMRGKLANGSWRVGFDPNYSEHIDGEFVEGNSWQWTPFVPHDPEGLAQLMGGPSKFGDWLNQLFSTSSEITGENASMDISGLIGQYAHGNEPSHHIPYLYQFTDRPWRTQEVLDQILYEFYLPTPEGIIGNEDCGQMSAWYVLNALGIYQLSPANKTIYIGRPLVEEAILQLPEGTFTITVENQSRENKYVAAVYMNDVLRASKTLNYDEITAGNRLRIVMSGTKLN